MWLDAFIKPNLQDMQKPRVSRVSGVSAPRKSNEFKGLAEIPQTDTGIKAQCQSVSVVSEQISTPNRLTRLTPTDTATKATCQDSETPRKPNEFKGLANRLTRLTRLTPQKHNAQEIAAPNLEELKQFRFDLVQQEIEDGHQADELHRVCNMTWEFMQADGMSFTDAMKLASEITISTQVAACEAAYVDVMALFKRLRESG
jgi:hypothetical protein